MRKTLLVLCAAVVAVVAIVTVGLLLVDWNWTRDAISTRVSDRLGLRLVIEGDIDVDLGLRPLVRIEKLRLENPDGFSGRDMIAMDEIALRVDLLELMRGNLDLPFIELSRPRIQLERLANGQANWQFEPAAPAKVAAEAVDVESRPDFPRIGRFEARHASIEYRDRTRDAVIAAELEAVQLAPAPDGNRLKVTAGGQLQDAPFDLEATAGSFAMLREPDVPYPVDVRIEALHSSARISGAVHNPASLEQLDLELELAGENPADLYPVIPVVLPPLAAYRLKGRLVHQGHTWKFEDFAGTTGESDLSGSISVDAGRRPVFVEGELESENLDFDDLAGLVGAEREEPQPESDDALPEEELDLDRLNAVDLRIRFRGTSIRAFKLPVDEMQALFVLEDGVLRVDPLEFGVGGGTLVSSLTIDGTRSPVSNHLVSEIYAVDLKRVLAEYGIAGESFGTIGGQMDVSSTGMSVEEALQAADGRASLVMQGGQLDTVLVEALGLDAGEIIAALTTEDSGVAIRCAVAELEARSGKVRAKTLVIDTTDTKISGSGSVNFADETLDLRLEPHAKDPSLFAAPSPIDITGTLDEPEVSVDKSSLALRGAAAAALGALATPLAALAAFVEPGTGDDANCRQLLQGQQRQTQEASENTGPSRQADDTSGDADADGAPGDDDASAAEVASPDPVDGADGGGAAAR